MMQNMGRSMESHNFNNPTGIEKLTHDLEEIFRASVTVVNIVVVLLIISSFIWPDWNPGVFESKVMQKVTLKSLGGVWLILTIWAKKK